MGIIVKRIKSTKTNDILLDFIRIRNELHVKEKSDRFNAVVTADG